jgi:predicted ATP-grasp superfamily ATP-dependent carboligase
MMRKHMPRENFTVLIPDGESWLSYSVQSCLAQIPGVSVVVLSNSQLEPMRFSKHTAKFYSYTTSNNSELEKLAAIYKVVKKGGIDLILPVDTKTMRLLAAQGQHIKALVQIAPLPEAHAIDVATNKWRLVEWLRQHQLPGPTTLLYQPNAQFAQALANLSFPVLLKPLEQIGEMGIGGRGIQIFDHPEQLLDYCNQNDQPYIVQPFIKGYDIDCSVLCINGKVVAHTEQKGFISAGSFAPAAGIDLVANAQAYRLVTDVVAKMNWTGVAHFDLRYDEQDQQIKVIEINARFWGSLLGSLCAGVNFPYLTCLLGLGRELPAPKLRPIRYVNGSAAVKLFIKRITGQGTITYDYSALDFMWQDPLPKVVAYAYKLCNKIANICKFSDRNAYVKHKA